MCDYQGDSQNARKFNDECSTGVKFHLKFSTAPHMSGNFLVNSKKNQIIWMLK